MLDRGLHIIYSIITFLVEDGIRQDWRKYSSKNGGREDYQIDLGIDLLNYAIQYDLDHKDELGYSGEYPNWMRQGYLDPCDCGRCWFCINMGIPMALLIRIP